MVLGEQQKRALERIVKFLNSDVNYFLLKGFAGTGKTSIVPEIIKYSSNFEVELMAPTGRAAKVLSEKSHVEASTIHRGIYKLSDVSVEMDNDKEPKIDALKTAEMRFVFDLKSEPTTKPRLIIVDESSMVQSRRMLDELYVFGSGSILRDLERYRSSVPGSKIIFIGDPAQLPPVGESKSPALEIDSFHRGEVEEFELTEVVRQDSDSIILSESMRIRQMMNMERMIDFSFREKPGELEKIDSLKALNEYVIGYKGGVSEMIITYSNRVALNYNINARKLIYGHGAASIVCNERLMVIQNNYNQAGIDLMNGDFVIVEDVVRPVESRNIPLSIKNDVSGVKEYNVELRFCRAKLLLDDGRKCESMLLLSLLTEGNPMMPYLINRAMYVDFRIRHRNLKPGSEEFRNALKHDEYYTALKVKYGYAITGHKSQGGEWDIVYVDFDGRQGLDLSTLRWDYTVVTRAKKKLYMIGSPSLNMFSRLDIKPISKSGGFPKMLESVSDTSMSVEDKRRDVDSRLSGTEFSVKDVKSTQYRDIYYIHCPGGDYRFDTMYNKNMEFKPFTTNAKGPDVEMVMNLLNSSRTGLLLEEYLPTSEAMSAIYEMIKTACDGCGVIIVRVKEYLKEYKIVYCLETVGKAYLDVFINSKGFVSNIVPHSTLGRNDVKLLSVLDNIEDYARSK